MPDELHLGGIHHLTAVTARIGENHRFYTEVLGMRMVKRTVNQDDVSAYHLFYADGAGSPGTDLTFFDWDLPRERRGTRSIVDTGLRVRGEAALRWWVDRLAEEGRETSGVMERSGRAVVAFEDPEGQRLTLVEDGGEGDPPVPWDGSSVPEEHQIRGLGPITLLVSELAGTETILTQVMGMRRSRSYDSVLGPDGRPVGSEERDGPRAEVHVFEMGDGGAHAELHVAVQPNLPPARLGAGGVHHVAFRTPTEESHRAWIERLGSAGIPNSGLVDRFYFRSLYFREPSGILFEIATDGPGFAVDEDPERLGESLALPPFLERRRKEIERNLQPIN